MIRPVGPVRHHVVVNAPVERAFELFTTKFDAIKPREHNLLTAPIEKTVFEPRVGGHIYDVGVDGSECRWARVLVYEPPSRLIFSWDIGPAWRLEIDPDNTSEVEVRFIAESDTRTRVELEHRHLERHGAGWRAIADGVDGEAGWPRYLDRYSTMVGQVMSSVDTAGQTTLMDLARAERTDLAAFLQTLEPQDWQAPSLCDKWSVKDVVAHMVSYEDLNTVGLIKRFAKGRIVRANEVGVEEFAPMGPDELLAYLNDHLQPRGLTAKFGGMIALVDATVHHQDIRRPLGRPRTIPVERLVRILPLIPGNPRLGAGKRIRGLRLRATDVDWQHGDGPEVVGTGEALLMAMTGRGAVLDELTGPGRATLAQRF